MGSFVDARDFVRVCQVDPAGVAAAVTQVAGVVHESFILDAVGRAVAEAALVLDGPRRPRLGGAGRRGAVARAQGPRGSLRRTVRVDRAVRGRYRGDGADQDSGWGRTVRIGILYCMWLGFRHSQRRPCQRPTSAEQTST